MPTTFLGPYDAAKLLSGVIPANKVKRPNWLQSFFSGGGLTDKDTVNFDVEFQAKNTMGMFVSPNADVTPITLNEFGTKELRLAYAKEGLNSPDYEEINVRQLGQPFGTMDVMANEAENLRRKFALAEQRFENLFELCASHIILYGAYRAASEKHPIVQYDFGRTKATTEAAANGDLVPSVNLTSAAVTAPWDASQTILPVISWTGGGTPRAWNKTNIDAGTATPVKDLVKIYETATFRAGVAAIAMSSDAYTQFNYDVTKNYPDSSNLTIGVLLRADRDVLPRIKDVQGLTYKRSWALENGVVIDIFVYDGTYNDRTTGASIKYWPDGWVVAIPPAENGVKVYGRIMHPRANYSAMPRWMNFWENPKTGKREWEIHTSFLIGHTDIDSVVAWKVI